MRNIKYQGFDGKNLLPVVRIHFDTDGAIRWSPYYDLHDNYNAEHHPLREYTGLKDKNGKEIYEGDIITYPDGGAWEVCWSGRTAGFYLFDPVNVDEVNIEGGEPKVIGNIYENPKLLEELK